ncbi:MAG: SAP domain-containing protein [Proteobacteria bacterium]|nr:SAP domain-containing protein [Pseudomonadota bacterium]
MKLQEIRTIARSKNVKPNGLSWADLIRAIQQQEGNFDCFGTADNRECDQERCLWRENCFTFAEK